MRTLFIDHFLHIVSRNYYFIGTFLAARFGMMFRWSLSKITTSFSMRYTFSSSTQNSQSLRLQLFLDSVHKPLPTGWITLEIAALCTRFASHSQDGTGKLLAKLRLKKMTNNPVLERKVPKESIPDFLSIIVTRITNFVLAIKMFLWLTRLTLKQRR